MKITQSHIEGASQIIQKGLGLLPGQNLLIIADETTYQVPSVLSDAAMKNGVSAMIVFIPQEQQKRIPNEYELSDQIQKL